MGKKETLLSMRKLLAVFLILSMLLALAGCVRYSVGCTVNSDGTVNLTYLYALNDMADSLGDSGWEEEKKQFESKGWSTRDYTGDGSSDTSSYNGFVATKGGIPIEQVQTEIRALGEGFETFTLTVDDDVYTIEWDTDSVDAMLSDEGSSFGDLATYGGYMKFTLELPTKPISQNATSSKGSRLEWDISEMDEPIHCEFELPKQVADDEDDDEDEVVSKKSKKKSSSKDSSFNVTTLIIVIVACVAVIAGGIVLAVFLVKRKKKNEYAAPIVVPAHAPSPVTPQPTVNQNPQPYVPQDPVPSQYSSSGLPTPYTSGSTSYTPGLPNPLAGKDPNDQQGNNP